MKFIRLKAVGLVTLTVLVQLVAALLLDLAAARATLPWIFVFLVIAVAIGLNLVRFLIWGYVHTRFPLSATYPLTAMFFPMILLVSYWQGEKPDGFSLLGTLFITTGVVLISWQDKERS